MDSLQFCPTCGLTLPAGQAGQGCPHCLLRLALVADEETDLVEQAASALPPLPSGLRVRFFRDYEILEELARGGMGVIYKARQLSLNRLVALKMIQPNHLFAADARLRFCMEIEAVAQLSHPHIVPLYESGEHDGVHFFTMRLMEGGNLAMALRAASATAGPGGMTRRNPFQVRSFGLGQFIDVVRAVQYAHERGVLHRDLKPSNVLLDSQGQPQVADFGLAKLLSHQSDLTYTESILGSPNYMAPEQAMGRSSQVTLSTDVYGLGTILYELLAGCPPFQSSTPIETIWRVCDEEPIPPSRFHPGLDADLETICLKCLRKIPGSRYASAEELALDLERWGEGRPIQARKLTRPQRAWRWCVRNPLLAAAFAGSTLLIAALVVGAVGAAWRIGAANRRVEGLLTRMQVQKAEELFSEGDSSKGLAMMAHVLRKDPGRLATALRLRSALEQRSYARPSFSAIHQGVPLILAAPLSGERECLTVTQSGVIQTWDLRSGTRARTRLELGRPVKHALLSEDRERLLVAFEGGAVQLRQGPDFAVARDFPSRGQELTGVAMSRGASWIATASEQAVVRLYHVETGEMVGEPRAHPSLLMDLGFSPDEAELVTVCADGGIRFWPVRQEGTQPARQVYQPSAIQMKFDSRGRWLAVGQHDGGVRLYDPSAGMKERWTFQHAHRITDLDFSSDSGLLVSAAWDDSARVWNLTNGLPYSPPLRHAGRVNSARFSPDASLVLTASSDATSRVWATVTGEPVTEGMPHPTGLSVAQFLEDPRRLLTTTYAGGLVGWELREPFVPTLQIRHPRPVTQVEFSPDSTLVASGSLAGDLEITAAATGKRVRRMQLNGGISCLSFSPNGRWLAFGGEAQVVHLADVARGKLAVPPLKHDRAVRGLEFDRAGERLLTIDWEKVHIWTVTNGLPLGSLLRHRQAVHTARFSPDGRSVLTVSEDRGVRVWSLTGREIPDWEFTAPSGAESAEFSPDGSRFVLIPRGHSAYVISLAARRQIGVELKHRAAVLDARFSPDGQRVVTASEDRTAVVWSPESPLPVVNTFAHQSRVIQAGFSPDGQRILTLTVDGVLRLWDIATGQLIADPLRHQAYPRAARFSPDGRKTVSAFQDGTVLIRPVPQWESESADGLIHLAEQIAKQRFVPPDWFELLPSSTGARETQEPSVGEGVGLRSLRAWLRSE